MRSCHPWLRQAAPHPRCRARASATATAGASGVRRFRRHLGLGGCSCWSRSDPPPHARARPPKCDRRGTPSSTCPHRRPRPTSRDFDRQVTASHRLPGGGGRWRVTVGGQGNRLRRSATVAMPCAPTPPKSPSLVWMRTRPFRREGVLGAGGGENGELCSHSAPLRSRVALAPTSHEHLGNTDAQRVPKSAFASAWWRKSLRGELAWWCGARTALLGSLRQTSTS